MNEEKKRILGMLAEGKITAEQAALLMDAVGPDNNAAPSAVPTTSPSADWPTGPRTDGVAPKFLYVKITGDDHVAVKVPLALMRAGLKLTSLIPPQAMNKINESMSESGMSIDFNNLEPEDLEAIVDSLGEMEVNIQAQTGENVRVFCA
jgi:hypothetical protein